jgi:hypothetical protein
MRRLGLAAMVLALTGCSGPTEDPDPAGPGASPAARGYAVGVERVRAGLSSVPVRPPPGFPAELPATDTPLPSALVDPPGRARMAYHPAEWWDDAGGWASETVLLLGTDGRWRRLELADLGLPESAWPGRDTYGSGELSPDGRWWAGRSRAGVILLDLRTGTHRLVELETDWVAQVRWLPDSAAFVVAHSAPGRAGLNAHRVAVPGLRTRAVPYEVWETGFEPDGTPLTLRRTRAGSYDVVAWPRSREVARGSVRLPLTGRLNRALATYPTAGRYAVITSVPGARPLDLVILDAATNEVEHVLRFERRVRLWNLWWLDPDTLLLQTRRGLAVWDLGTGSIRPVTTGPEPNGEPWWVWSVDVAHQA